MSEKTNPSPLTKSEPKKDERGTIGSSPTPGPRGPSSERDSSHGGMTNTPQKKHDVKW
jgi:hypothetical protein